MRVRRAPVDCPSRAASTKLQWDRRRLPRVPLALLCALALTLGFGAAASAPTVAPSTLTSAIPAPARPSAPSTVVSDPPPSPGPTPAAKPSPAPNPMPATAAPPTPALVPVQKALPAGKYFRSWLLCGPFPDPPGKMADSPSFHFEGFAKDYLTAHGGESNPHIVPGQIETFNGGSARWISYTSDSDVIRLDTTLSKAPFVLAYAYCEIEADKDLVCLLALGSNDGARMWLNGHQVFDHPGGRQLKMDNDLVPVALHAGKNSLLLKIEQRGARWEFALRILTLNHELAEGRVRLFDVLTSSDGVASLHFMQSKALVGKLIQKANLQVVSAAEPNTVLWSQPWNENRDMTLGVHPNSYEEYILRITLNMVDGAVAKSEIHFFAGKRVEHVLFAHGKTRYTIVVGKGASDSEKWAATQLQQTLKKISGANFPIRDDSGPPTANEIIVGYNRHVKTLLGPDTSVPADTDESFTYRNFGPHIIIIGGKQRGTMYGVMSFLERVFGCRWYTPEVTVIPKRSEFSFHYFHHSESPGIRVRNDFYYEAFDPIWAAHNRINGAMNYRKQPGGVEGYWSVHTFYQLVPPSEFFATHPEYYSLVNGKRTADHAQLCLTNPDVLKIVVRRIKKIMRENPQYLIYSVSQNDCGNPCQCDKCQAIAKKEGSESGPIIHFVNEVAKQVQSEFPNKFIGTLAYNYSRKPPATIKPRSNVVVRLCTIECCFSHDLRSCPQNASFLQDMDGWNKLAQHLYIWDYVVNFAHYVMPFPNFRVLQPNMQYFRDHHAIGVMEEGDYQGRGGEFAELRAYVLAKLLWDPDCNVNAVINDFMYGYYGRAGQYVRRYFDLLHNRITPETHIHLGLQPDDNFFSDEFVRQAEWLFDRAEAVADNDQIRRRVEMARLPIMYLKCMRTPELAKRDGTYERFKAITKREGVTFFSESGASQRKAFFQKMDAIP